MAKELREDPAHFAGKEAGDFFLGAVIAPMIVSSLFMLLLFVFGFTNFLFGPVGILKFIFFLFLFPYVIFFSILFRAYKVIKTTTRKAVDNTLKVESKVIEQ